MSLPASVIELFEGRLGIPHGGFPRELQQKVLKGKVPAGAENGAAKAELPSADLEQARRMAGEVLNEDQSPALIRDGVSYLLYPHVLKEFGVNRWKYGALEVLPTLTYFYGLLEGEEINVDIEPGKRLFISLVTVTEAGESGERTVMFELNGQPRSISVRDLRIIPKDLATSKADPGNDRQVGAPLSGAVVSMDVKIGDKVTKDKKLFTLETMKMQTAVTSISAGTVKRIVTPVGTRVEVGDLVLELE